jgi:membrane peptidoglycan carboxypeptidase
MTERPEKPNDKQQGGWHSPATSKLWQAPRQETQPRGAWRKVDALPRDMSPQPESKGGWHLPEPEDTIFNPGDKVEIKPKSAGASTSPNVLRPEDLIAQITGHKPQPAQVARPEDFSFSYQQPAPALEETDTVPGDVIDPNATIMLDEPETTGMSSLEALGALDDDEEEEESVGMSELIALAALAEGQDTGEVSTQHLNRDDLSPAERLLYQTAADAESELPQPSPGDTQTLTDTGQQPAATGTEDPAAYAARMAREVSQPDYAAGYGQQQQPQVQLTPQEQELAAKFRETRRQVGVLRQRYEQGQIDYQQLQAELQQNSILDPQGIWWMLGYESDQWFRYNNTTSQWEAATPPVPLDNPSPATQTGTSGMPQVIAGQSLPYLPDDGGTVDIGEYTQDYDGSQYADAQRQYSQQYGVTGDTPIPNPDQPVYDPGQTMVGQSAYTENLPGAQPTVQNLNIVEGFDPQQTMPSVSIDEPTIGSMMTQPTYARTTVYDEGAPDYDAQDAAPEIYVSERERQQRRLVTGLIIGAFVVFGCAIITGVSFFAYAAYWYDQTVTPYRAQIAALANYQPEFQIARVLDASGEEIMTLTSQEGAREPVSIEAGEVSPFFIHAVVSSEDPTYFENPGLNVLSIARAFWQNLTAGEIQSGASTITQQIASNLVLQSKEPTAERKATEIAIALEIANTYSKNQVLDIYINEFPFGNQTFGVEAASQLYFNIPASDLDMAQSAMLAGLLPAPESSNPVRDREAAFDAMTVVIDRMIRTGCLNFQHGEWAANGSAFCINDTSVVEGSRLLIISSDGSIGGLLSVQIARVETRNYRPRDAEFIYPHFRNLIVELIESEFGPNALYQRGFTIRTTLLPNLQEAAEAQLIAGLTPYAFNGIDNGAVVVLDANTGAIRAWVGSPDFNDEDIDGQVDNNRTWQQPGSAIKPIVYTIALSGGGPNGYLTPASVLWDVQSQYDTDGNGVADYAPVNFDGQFRGPVSLRSALAQSLNVPSVKVFEFIGIDAFTTRGRAMGLGFLENAVFGLPSALGANEVRLVDLAEAYGTLAADGVFHRAYAIESITENINGRNVEVDLAGTSLERPAPQQVVSPQVAFLMQSILSDDNARAPQFGQNGVMSGASFGLPNQNYVAAKTGTSTGTRDLWTMGFTNNWVVGVWVGTTDNSAPTGNLTSGGVAGPIWNGVLREALRISGANPGAFAPPSDVIQATVCRLTGAIVDGSAGNACPSDQLVEIFARDLPPQQAGFIQTIEVDSWTGLRANQWCPNYHVAQTFSNIRDPFATNWLNSTPQGQAILRQLNITGPLSAPPANECQQGQTIPSIDLTFPAAGSTVQATGTFAITGQISASDMQRWELEYAPVGSEQWQDIPLVVTQNQQVPQAGTVLAQWNTTQVPNNTYRLRLIAFSNANGSIVREATVQIQNIPPTPTPAPTSLPPTPTPFFQQPFTPLPFESPLPGGGL